MSEDVLVTRLLLHLVHLWSMLFYNQEGDYGARVIDDVNKSPYSLGSKPPDYNSHLSDKILVVPFVKSLLSVNLAHNDWMID